MPIVRTSSHVHCFDSQLKSIRLVNTLLLSQAANNSLTSSCHMDTSLCSYSYSYSYSYVQWPVNKDTCSCHQHAMATGSLQSPALPARTWDTGCRDMKYRALIVSGHAARDNDSACHSIIAPRRMTTLARPTRANMWMHFNHGLCVRLVTSEITWVGIHSSGVATN